MRWTLTRIIATVGCTLAAAAAAVFLVLATERMEETPTESVLQYANARLITPKTYGSYGELMFAYVGPDNYLYNLDDESVPLICQPVRELLYASDDTVLYTASCELDDTHPGRESVIQELQIGAQENRVHTIAQVTVDPCWSSNDEVIYYVEDHDTKRLCTFEPLTSTSEAAAEFEQNIIGLRISSDGLLVLLSDGEELLYVPLSKQLTMPGVSGRGHAITVCEQYDLFLSSEGTLSYHWQGSDESVLISEHVLAGISHQDNEIYYIRQDANQTELMCFVVSEEQHRTLAVLDAGILPQLTSDADYAFLLNEQGVVYRYDIQDNTLVPYHLIDMESVRAPMISLFDYRLMVYDLARGQDQAYCYAIPSNTVLSAEDMEALTEQAKDLSEEFTGSMTSGEYTYLSMGATGEQVTRLQNVLSTRGYLPYESTGIYGAETLYAVAAAQSDLGLPATGYADSLFQSLLAGSDVHQQMHRLDENEVNVPARNLEARLITLGYILRSEMAGEEHSLKTGITRFCEQNNLEYDGAISEEIQSAILSKDASHYNGYFALHQGDIGDACSKVNAQLNLLGYSAYASRPMNDVNTNTAMQLFAQVNHLSYADAITPELQENLFSEQAVPCPAEYAPAPLTDSASSTTGQVITDKELKILRKWLTKTFAVNHTDRQAVKRFQMRLIRLGYLAAGDSTMIYDSRTEEAVRSFQADHELTVDGIPSKKTLMELFGIASATLSGE